MCRAYISKIIPMVNCLSAHFQNFETIGSSTSIKAVKKTLDPEMLKRLRFIEQNRRLAFSTLLDPRFKNIEFRNPTACGNAILKPFVSLIVTIMYHRL